MRPCYNVLIIGAGRIGALFDFPEKKEILTHAHAFSSFDGFNLLGFYDTDIKKTQIAAERWKVKAFESLEEAFNSFRIDVVCVAVSDDQHYFVLKKLANFPVGIIFVEKPLAKTLEEAGEIMSFYEEKKIPVAVNYSRRFIPEIERLKNEYDDGKYGRYVSGTGYYGKGVLNNGSHLLDFLNYFFCGVGKKAVVSGVYDFYKNDPTVSAVLKINGNKSFFLQEIDCNLYTIFEMDLLFEKKRIKISDASFNVELYDVLDDEIYDGYKNIVKTKEEKVSFGRALYFAALNIYQHLSRGEELKCSASDAYKAMKDCLDLKSMFENG